LNFWAELVYNFTSRNSVLSGAEALMRPLHSPPAMLLRPDASSAWLMPGAHTASPRAWRAAPILLPFFRCNSAWPKARCCEPCWAAELPARWCHPLLVKARGARGDGLSIVANPRVEQRAAELESDCDNLRKGAGRRAARRTRTRERQRRTYKRNARPPAYGSSTCKPERASLSAVSDKAHSEAHARCSVPAHRPGSPAGGAGCQIQILGKIM
jgi:hypothetical protein